MRHISNIIVTLIVTFLVTLALNFFASYLSQDKGTVAVGPTCTIQGKAYATVSISNFSSGSLDDVVLSVPSAVTPPEIIASAPIRVSEETDNVGAATRKQISISGIGHNRVTMLQIPVSENDVEPQVEIMNAKQKQLTVMPVADISNPSTHLLGNALVDSALNVLFLALFLFWARPHFIEMDNRMKELKDSMRRDQDRFDEVQKESKRAAHEATVMFGRMKVTLLARMADYSRELSFWRDTARKVLYGSTGGSEAAGEALVKHVTECLQTYQTKSGFEHDFEAMKVLAGLMFKPDGTGEKG